MSFFQGFSLDTLLGCISCILGIVSFFVGTKAYKKCSIMEASLNDHKVFNDSSSDNSQRAAGNIINNSCDVEALAKITASNFEVSLKQAYGAFEQQVSTNLYQIIEQTKKIIQDQKPNIAGLTKIDWINIYFESAKNTSDKYMQGIWAKLLARELEHPGSFSFLTLDALKNMTSGDFRIFEKLCSFQINGWIFQEDIYSKYGLSYLELVQLSEYGLLNMGLTNETYKIEAHKSANIIYQMLLIQLINLSDKEQGISFPVYLLSSIAKELLSLVNASSNEDYARDCVKILVKTNNQVKVSLHRINSLNDTKINYKMDDLSRQ